MKEALLFVLKQILDDFGTSNNAMDIGAARVFLDHIRSSIQDRKCYILAIVAPPSAPIVILGPQSEAGPLATTTFY